MELKKAFAEPLCEVTRFAVEDIVTSSAEDWQTDLIIDEIAAIGK